MPVENEPECVILWAKCGTVFDLFNKKGLRFKEPLMNDSIT